MNITAERDCPVSAENQELTKQKVTAELLHNRNHEKSVVSSDDDLSKFDVDSIVAHDQKYAELLTIFVLNTRVNVYIKIFCKPLFFVCSLIFMGVVLWLLRNIIIYAIANPTSENIVTLLITGIVAFLSTFIVIPTAITHYLFNPKEDESMTQIIKNLQEYDLGIRNGRK